MIENVRFKVIFKPGILKIMDEQVSEGWHFWGKLAEDKKVAKWFAENWDSVINEAREKKY